MARAVNDDNEFWPGSFEAFNDAVHDCALKDARKGRHSAADIKALNLRVQQEQEEKRAAREQTEKAQEIARAAEQRMLVAQEQARHALKAMDKMEEQVMAIMQQHSQLRATFGAGAMVSTPSGLRQLMNTAASPQATP